MSLRYEAESTAPPAAVWPLMARPDAWSDWAPHVRGADGLGDPEVEAGRRGHVRLLGFVPIPAEITAKDPGRSWAWRVGPVTLVHRVEPHGKGSLVVMEIEAPRPLEATLRVTYGPLVALLVRNLARSAGRK
jgi:Polyketide cyclase / dehydrase and lipid transport